jgi:hypothetical protein
MPVLIAFLLGLLTGIKKVNFINKASEPKNDGCDSTPGLQATLNIPAPVQPEGKTKEHKNNGLEIYLAFIQTATMAAVIWYAIINSHMLDKMKESTEAAKTASDIAELSQRPWIKIVDVQTHGDNSIIPALSFQGYGYGVFPAGNKQATLQLKVSLKNIGQSVAQVYVDYELFFPAWDSSSYADAVRAEQKLFCSKSSEIDHSPVKFIVFPDDPLDWHGAISQPINEGNINHVSENKEGVILPVVIICADYRLPNSPKTYQTSVLYEVFHAGDRSRFFTPGEDLPAKRLLLMRNPSADDAY